MDLEKKKSDLLV